MFLVKNVTLIFDLDLDPGTTESSYHKEDNVKYESSITYHSKVMANVKVYTDKHTGQKQHAPLIYRCGGGGA